MSVKNNAFLAAAALALSITPTAGAAPVVEALLNDYSVSGLYAAEVSPGGRVLVFAVVTKAGETVPEIRAVAASNGDVRLYGGVGALESLVKRCKMQAGSALQFVRMEKTGSVGDPIATLKTQYKSYKAEKALGLKNFAVIDAKRLAGIGLGWNTQVGTPEAAEFADYLEKSALLTEWTAFTDARITALAASLTAAGVDPLTVI